MMFETAVYMPTDQPVNVIVQSAIVAESAGFDYFLVPDEGLTHDVFVTLTAIALNTGVIKFGPAIVNPYTRHPVASAVTMATLDELSGGRAFIGFGSGGSLVLGPMGVEMNRPLQMCREAIEMTRLLYAGESVDYRGELFKLNKAKIQFKCRADIPIYVAGRGNKMLEQAGELADGVLLSGIPKFDLQRTCDIIRKGAAGRDGKPKIFYDVLLAFNDMLLERVREDYSFMIIDSPPHVKQELGLSDEYIENIRQVMLEKGLHAASRLISSEILSHFIILGDEEACANELVQIMRQYEFDVFTLPIPPVDDPMSLIQQTAQIANRARWLIENI
jgi:5,10-methylenetetrahydromethanopterin reductase